MAISFQSQHSKYNRSELHSGMAGCFHCLSLFDVSDIRKWDDAYETALCPLCTMDTVMSKECLPVGPIEVKRKQLRDWQWWSFNYIRGDDFKSAHGLQEIVQERVDVAQMHPIRHQMEEDYVDLENFVLEMGIADDMNVRGFVCDLALASVHDDRYNEWQNKTIGQTDGITEDGNYHLKEYERACEEADLGCDFGQTVPW